MADRLNILVYAPSNSRQVFIYNPYVSPGRVFLERAKWYMPGGTKSTLFETVPFLGMREILLGS